MDNLSAKHCIPCEGGVPPLDKATITQHLSKLDGWNLSNDDRTISRVVEFKNYYETMAFVNAIAWMAHYENHHPDLEVAYNHCKVSYTTHAIGGLSENDFICATKVDKLFRGE